MHLGCIRKSDGYADANPFERPKALTPEALEILAAANLAMRAAMRKRLPTVAKPKKAAKRG